MEDKTWIKLSSAIWWLEAIIGVTEWERKEPQDIRVNIELYVDLKKCGKSDKIADTVNYESIANEALEIGNTAHRQTVEALAEDIAEMCLSRKLVQKVIVRVEKSTLIRFADSVGVEIERAKGNS